MITDTDAQVSEIATTLRLFVAPRGTGEIRVIGCGAPFGIFFRHDEIPKAAALAAKYSQTAKGCYLVMNPIAPALAERPQLVKTFTLTTDADIVHRNMLLIDFDPSSAERGSNDSATDAEKETARERMDEVFEWLRDLGFPEPIFADSGNGWHLLFRIDLPNDDQSRKMLRYFLLALSKRFSDDQVAVDITVHNASRITKLYGTQARKGEHREDRPHRLSRLLTVPEGMGTVTPELIVAATKAALAEATPVSADSSLFDHQPTATPRINGQADTHTASKLILPETFPVGGRHDAMTRLAGAVRSFGSNEKEIYWILKVFNASRCAGGKPDDELAKIARDYSTKDANLSMKALIEGQSAATTRRILPVGTRVKAADQDNFGDVVRDNGGDTITVHFRSPTGDEATKDLAVGLLTLDDGSPVVPTGFTLSLKTSEEFLATNYRQHFLIRRLLVEGQCCVLGGPKKVLKTSLLVDLAISLGTGTPFLGHPDFLVHDSVPVLLLSGESGGYTLKETARRIALAKNRLLSSASVYWGFYLPQLANGEHLKVLEGEIIRLKIKVAIIDPAYLCLLSAGASSNITANVFAMGALLKNVSDIGQRTGCTIIIAHHTRKADRQSSPFAVPDLEDLSGSGFAEWARQWFLLNRREAYVAGSGEHRLWMNVGGSAGHSGTWALDINEGTIAEDGDGRTWDVTVSKATEAAQQSRAAKEQAKDRAKQETAERNAERILAVLRKSAEPLTARKLRTKTSMSSTTFDAAFAFVEDYVTEEKMKGGSVGYRLSKSEAGQAGQ